MSWKSATWNTQSQRSLRRVQQSKPRDRVCLANHDPTLKDRVTEIEASRNEPKHHLHNFQDGEYLTDKMSFNLDQSFFCAYD
jgi:hypothetical protein